MSGHGSAAAAFTASRNLKTLGIEQFTENHKFGSSHGRSRIIRMAYFEDPRCKFRVEFHLMGVQRLVCRCPITKASDGTMERT